MSSIDLSRQLTDPRKHYAGVRMQQGRVLTDDDFNEAAAIDAEELRRTRLHAIGRYGTPDSGFVPKAFGAVNQRVDFVLSKGNLYLGGLRLEMSDEEHFLEQKDWLNFDPAVDAPAAPAEGQTRVDLAWIEAWQQPTTAIEDSELFETALGGADTTTRWRTMRRVHITAGVAGMDCADAWAAVSGGFGAIGTLNDELELATTATLTVTFAAPPAVGDLCSPSQPGGFLGAENQAIRVQMVDATHYTWGYDNAAPLYRAKLSAKGGQLVELTLLNQPKDAVHWPLKDQVVELLPWSAALANGERIAELSGHLCKVLVSYNPDDFTLQLDTAVAPSFGKQWQARGDVGDFFDGTADEEFFYLRVWNRGDDLASPAAIPIATAALGNTGLQVAFGGAPLRAADYWIIAARPAAPNVLVPWILGLAGGAAPNGIKRYRAPIALLSWTTQGGVVTGSILHDCRPPFLPLTRLRGCCSVTVGDGNESFGQFTSVQAAIDSLPPSGGTVCILPGRYVESVQVVARHNVTLHGCGPRSRIVAQDPEGVASTAIHVADSRDVVVESLALEGGASSVIVVERSEVVRIAGCLIQARDERETASPWPAVFVDGEMLEIEDNIVEILPNELERVFHELAAGTRGRTAKSARGGIQLAGGCDQVRVAGNVIVGGTGNGITLGSILRIDDGDPNGKGVPDIDIDDPCAPCNPTDGGTPPDDGGKVRYESAGDLYRIEIADNVITRHGANGIAAVRFFGPSAKSGLVLVAVHGLRITRNAITGCLRRAIAQAPAHLLPYVGYAGISLAVVTQLEIDGNVIHGNGRDWRSPICGIFVLVAEGLRVEHNQITANGARNEAAIQDAQKGIRAGVHVWLAFDLQSGTLGNANPDTKRFKAVSKPSQSLSQLRIHGNQIEQPLGRALFLLGAGVMNVTDNRLVSEGTGVPATDSIASTVLVANFGVSREWTQGLLMAFLYLEASRGDKNLAGLICALSKRAASMPGVWTALPTGKLMFNDNQVSFQMRDAPRGLSLSSSLLFSLDDVAASDNQFEYHTEERSVLADLLAVGATVRSNDNRLAETWGRASRSILSLALLNTAADNQSTHCISALGFKRAVHHNLVLAEAFCAGACGQQKGFLGNVRLGVQSAAVGNR